MTREEGQALDVLLEMVKEISETNKNEHKEIIKRINCIKTGCHEREKEVDKQIAEVAARPTPFEVSVKTIAKFSAALLVNVGVIVGILATAGVFH